MENINIDTWPWWVRESRSSSMCELSNGMLVNAKFLWLITKMGLLSDEIGFSED